MTVGLGIAPNLLTLPFGRKALAGLGPKDPYRRWGITPRPENIGHPTRATVNNYDETPTSGQAPPPWGTVMRLCGQRRHGLPLPASRQDSL